MCLLTNINTLHQLSSYFLLLFSGKLYSWPRKLDEDNIDPKYIFARNVKFQGNFPAKLCPMENFEELYEKFRKQQDQKQMLKVKNLQQKF